MSYVENFLLMCMVIKSCISICKIMHKYIWQHGNNIDAKFYGFRSCVKIDYNRWRIIQHIYINKNDSNLECVTGNCLTKNIFLMHQYKHKMQTYKKFSPLLITALPSWTCPDEKLVFGTPRIFRRRKRPKI